MTVAFVTGIVGRFSVPQSAFGPIRIDISPPWHFNESKGKHVPFEAEHGLYLYTRPNIPEWDIPANNNENPVYYVGKSAGDIGGRVWGHVVPIYDPETKLVCVPRFKFHRWSKVPSVPDDVRESIANGNVVVYAISVRSEPQAPVLSELLEKYVLVHYVLAKGNLPVLNLQL